MLFQLILDPIFQAVIDSLSGVSISFVNLRASDALQVVADFIRFVCYFFPMDVVRTILGITISLQIFRVVVSLIKTLWGLLPVV